MLTFPTYGPQVPIGQLASYVDRWQCFILSLLLRHDSPRTMDDVAIGGHFWIFWTLPPVLLASNHLRRSSSIVSYPSPGATRCAHRGGPISEPAPGSGGGGPRSRSSSRLTPAGRWKHPSRVALTTVFAVFCCLGQLHQPQFTTPSSP